jgi:hypothetical protein
MAVPDEFAALGLQIFLNHPDPFHRGGNAFLTFLGKQPVMCQQFAHVHDFYVGLSGFPELAFLQGGKSGGPFGFHIGDSMTQRRRPTELYLDLPCTP